MALLQDLRSCMPMTEYFSKCKCSCSCCHCKVCVSKCSCTRRLWPLQVSCLLILTARSWQKLAEVLQELLLLCHQICQELLLLSQTAPCCCCPRLAHAAAVPGAAAPRLTSGLWVLWHLLQVSVAQPALPPNQEVALQAQHCTGYALYFLFFPLPFWPLLVLLLEWLSFSCWSCLEWLCFWCWSCLERSCLGHRHSSKT